MLTVHQSEQLKDRGIKVICMDPGWVKTRMGGEGAILEPHESIGGVSTFSPPPLTPAVSQSIEFVVASIPFCLSLRGPMFVYFFYLRCEDTQADHVASSTDAQGHS
jgi:NAD(P)-dependent dehydrogenase (short-subunit alcohol dehydrogenase family)